MSDYCSCGGTCAIVDYDENDNRIRTREKCRYCRAERYGCFAKRLDSDGQPAWGPPGKWWYSAVD